MYIHHIALSKTDIHLIKQEVVIGDNHTELSNLHVLVQITVHSTSPFLGWVLTVGLVGGSQFQFLNAS